MPAKRRAPVETPAPKGRRSALAKEHNITSEQETEIREAFSLFTTDKKITDESAIPINDVRRAMKALDLGPSPDELSEFISILDPEKEGYALYSSFVAICALKLQNKEQNPEGKRQEVEEAFLLFTRSGEEKITMATLKRVARALKEDVNEDVLRDMILEANGGAGVQKGVQKEEFEGVMKRAGMWR